ncbi:F-actin-monooxygenase MICAL3 isoform X2 [Drosophila hydei]|uniref:F-actin-monooxygenase MICAL3 isoform X2 n=1 Tax=Drosophila hydei TaxID=7224 RepID=A0A6J1LH22_DROHY|nr:F-actin-monooxygenase MICAL3 isoform X2 [Drosophila hydei]
MKTVINAEEEHLVSKSVKTRTATATATATSRKTKTNSKMETLVDTKVLDLESTTNLILENVSEGDASAKPKSPNSPNSDKLSVNNANDSNVTVEKKKSKSKKSKKCVHDNQNISVKSSFNKFDALQKRNLIHNLQDEQQTNCKLCSKPVYKMEEVIVQFKSDKAIYHKSCLRCKGCSKQLKFDNYQSHEGDLYCNVHFKLLFAPKVVEQAEEPKQRKTELIIRESQPVELPPDVVRASDKPDLGLDELHQLNVRSRFELFENVEQNKLKEEQLLLEQRPVIKRTKSVLTKYRPNDVDYENRALNENDDEPGEEDEDADLIRSKKNTQKERPVGLGDAMIDIKTRFEKGSMQSKEERREERKQEIQNIRSRLFMGKQAKIKEMYQQAVAESEQAITSIGKQPDVEIGGAARSIKERFEKGQMFNDKDNESRALNGYNGHGTGLSEDADVFESAISKKSRSIFIELDANMASNTNVKCDFQRSPSISLNKCSSQSHLLSDSSAMDVIKCDTKAEDIKVATAELSQKFKFFETYRPKDGDKRQFRITPPREGVVKMPSPDSESDIELVKQNFHDNVLQKTQTTSTMLNKFREMEQNKSLNATCNSPRPLKCFTPPPAGDRRNFYDKSNSEEEEDDDDDDEENDSDYDDEIDKEIVNLNSDNGDEALREAQNAARAKQLRAKFEKWQANEIKRDIMQGYVDIYSEQVSDDSTIESAKAIRERFENMKNVECKSTVRPRHQVNRFV